MNVRELLAWRVYSKHTIVIHSRKMVATPSALMREYSFIHTSLFGSSITFRSSQFPCFPFIYTSGSNSSAIMSTPRTLLRSLCSPRLYQYNTANTCYRASTRLSIPSARPFSAFSSVKMPSNPSQGEINSQTDPSVAKQYDTETSKVEQITDYFKLVDGMKISMLNTYRNGVGKCSLSRFPSPAIVLYRYPLSSH